MYFYTKISEVGTYLNCLVEMILIGTYPNVPKGLYTWSDLHTCANFAYMQNLHTYANRSMCTHLLTYAKFARMQKLENLHLPQTKCKSHFAYMQILHICKSGHVNAK